MNLNNIVKKICETITTVIKSGKPYVTTKEIKLIGKNITPNKKKCGKVGLFILNQFSSEMKSRAQGQTDSAGGSNSRVFKARSRGFEKPHTRITGFQLSYGHYRPFPQIMLIEWTTTFV